MWSRASRAFGRVALAFLGALGCSRAAPPAPEQRAIPGASASTSSAPVVVGAPTTCLEARPACRGRLAIGAAGKHLAYYASRPLDGADARPTRAVIVLHGARHSPEDYFQTMTGLAAAHGGLEATVVIAPHFQTASNRECWGATDAPAPDELYWSCEGWKMGGAAEDDAAVSSFDALDALIADLPRRFPGLTHVTLAGHSAGAQLVQRYAAVTRIEETQRVPITFLVSSPSSYLYLDDRRLKKDARCTSPTDCALDKASFEAPFHGAKACPGYDDFKYGLAHREGYAARAGEAEIRRRYAARDVVLLLGDRDTGKAPEAAFGELDKSCAANAQGPRDHSFRLERGLVYARYVSALFGARHALAIVPGCGHEDACLFASAEATRQLFER
ncbi:MAG: alpha/beta fold hydrolase [Minicystis sp.]